MNDKEIKKDFDLFLKETGEKLGFSCQPYYGIERETTGDITILDGVKRVSKNIKELSGSINCLVYYRICSKEPYWWGVTANRISELKQSGKHFVIILLYDSPETGYFIMDKEFDSYIRIWTLLDNGEYSVKPGSLESTSQFRTFNELIDLLSYYRNQN